MRVLILGATGFIGRHITEVLLSAGHRVTTLNRGNTPDELPEQVVRLRGDRDQGSTGHSALRGRDWDACIDVSGYTPRHVRPSAQMLSARVQRYVFVSAVSVYGDPTLRPVRENHPRVPPAAEDVTELDAITYATAKVACEDIVQQIYGDRCTLLRPQVVVGPHDPSGRYSYWVQRAQQGGDMLAPGDGTDHLQVIDVRDLAGFAKSVVENDLTGPFNLAGPRITWAEFIGLLKPESVTWVPADIITAAGVTEFELPLFRSQRGPRSGLMDICNQRARSAGLVLTDPAITLRDMRVWLRGINRAPLLSPARVAELISLARRAARRSPIP